MNKKSLYKLIRVIVFSIIILAVIIYHYDLRYDDLNFANTFYIDIMFAAAIVGILLEIYKK